MNDLLVVTALRIEYAALAGRVPGATLARCGMGPEKVREWLPRLVTAGAEGGCCRWRCRRPRPDAASG